MSDNAPPTYRVLTWIRRFALTIGGIALGWIVIGNIFLNTPIASWTINRHPERWKVTWDRAWTLYPGGVVATGVTYEHNIGRTHVRVRAESASCRIPIRPLLERRFVLDGIVASGTRTTLERRPAQPPKPLAPKASSAKPRKPGWHIEILSARVDSIDEFAFDDVSMAGGSSSASGSFVKQLGGNMELRDVVLDWKEAQVRIKGSDSATTDVSIAFCGGMTLFNTRVDRGWAVLKHLSGTLDIDGRIISLTPLQALFEGSGWLTGLNGAGEVSAHLLIDKGQFSPDSRLKAQADDLAIAFMDSEARGAGHVGFTRDVTTERDMTHIELALDEFSFDRVLDGRPLARGKNLQVNVDALNFRLGTPADEVKVVVDLPVSEMPDVAVLGEWLPEALGLKLAKGRAQLSAHLESTGLGRPARGTFHVRGQGLAGEFRDLDFKIDMDAEMRLSGSEWNELKVTVDGTRLRLFNGDIHGEGVPVEPGWWMSLGVTNGSARLGKPLSLEGDVELKMRDLRALLAVVAEMKDWLKRVDGILAVKDLEGRTHAKFGNERISLDALRVDGDRLACEGDVHLGGGKGDGLVWLKFRRRDLALEWEGPKRDWKLYNDRKWFDKRRAERATHSP